MMDYSIKIGGEAGQGIQTIGGTLAKVFTRAGYHVFTHQDYESRIRGGHNFYQIRFSDRPVTSSRDVIDILIALDKSTLTVHAGELSAGGLVIYDSSALGEKHDASNYLDIPFQRLAEEHGGSRIMANTVAIGAVLGALGIGLDVLEGIFREAFAKKGEDIVQGNIRTAAAGHGVAVTQCGQCSFSTAPVTGAKMLIAGNEALGLGVIASGCRFYSAYPMTPSTGVMLYAAARAGQYGIVVEQAEDEISAINMALGASFAGVRSMTGTSGGGFALMVEGLSLASMTETPIVIVLAQRPGPATGLPTRTEQGDLLFALRAAHGEFPRVLFAPGSPEQAFYLTNKAFDIAEKYQVPVIILSDQYLADSQWSCDGLDVQKLRYGDYRLRGSAFRDRAEYRRHALTENGVSPLGVPGDSHHLVVTDSDEHDEDGHIIEDAQTRKQMVDKRLFRKLSALRSEIAPPSLYGSDRPEIVLVGWGSTFGVMKEAVDSVSEHRRAAMVHFSELYPFPAVTPESPYVSFIEEAAFAVCVENNATGQFAYLMKAETGFEFKYQINKYDGRPFTLEGLLGELRGHIEGI